MRRQCTELEKEILYNNRGDILSGTLEGRHGNGVVPIFIGIVVGAVISIPIAFAMRLTDKYAIEGVMLVCIAIAIAGIQIVFRKIGISRDKNKIFKDQQVDINGATILGINNKDGFFVYVEDDFYDGQGRLQKIAFPVNDPDKIAPGMRIMAVRTSDGSYFLMNVSNETRGFISGYSPVNLSDQNAAQMLSQSMIPHPNAFYMDVNPRLLTQNEKVAFLNNAGSFNAKNDKIGMVCFSVSIIIIALLTFVILVGSEVITQFRYAMLWLAGLIVVGVGLIILFKKLLQIRSKKRFEQDVYVQRVLLISYDFNYIGFSAQAVLRVYEYVNGVMDTQSYLYPVYNEKKPYGTVLYKCTSGNNTYFTSKL